jgi:hypothetical protein
MLSSAQLTQLYQNFNITAGGVITIKRKGEFVHFKWTESFFCAPIIAGAANVFYNIVLPGVGTTIM